MLYSVVVLAKRCCTFSEIDSILWYQGSATFRYLSWVSCRLEIMSDIDCFVELLAQRTSHAAGHISTAECVSKQRAYVDGDNRL